jgi:hypothetical protein
MLVPLDEWATSAAATIEIFSFPGRPPGGGTFGFPKSGLAPAPKTWPKTVFETKYLIYFIFSTARVIWSDRADPVPARRLAGQIWPPPRSRLVLVKLSGDDDQAERARLRAT